MLQGGWICYEIYYKGCWICSEIRYKGLGYATRYDPTGHTCCMINSLGGLIIDVVYDTLHGGIDMLHDGGEADDDQADDDRRMSSSYPSS